MIDYLKRLRSPALMAVLAVIGVLVLMSIGHFIVLLMRGTGIPGAARQAGATSPSLLWVFAAVALAVTCVLIRPVVTNAQKLVGAAAILVASAAAVSTIFWVVALFGGMTLGVFLGALGGLIEIAAKAACAWVLWRMRGLGAAERSRSESSRSLSLFSIARSLRWMRLTLIRCSPVESGQSRPASMFVTNRPASGPLVTNIPANHPVESDDLA